MSHLEYERFAGKWRRLPLRVIGPLRGRGSQPPSCGGVRLPRGQVGRAGSDDTLWGSEAGWVSGCTPALRISHFPDPHQRRYAQPPRRERPTSKRPVDKQKGAGVQRLRVSRRAGCQGRAHCSGIASEGERLPQRDHHPAQRFRWSPGRGLPRPARGGPRGGVVVIHHMPGYDRATKEMVRRFAELGYDAICPNLYSREAPGAAPDDAAATSRAQGGVPDERLVGDVGGAAATCARCRRSNGEGRRHRPLLGRPAGRPGRLPARPGRGGGLLRRVRHRAAAGGLPAEGDQPRRPARRRCGARCSACSATRTRPRARSTSTSWTER